MSHHFFEISTHGPGLYEFTDQVARWVAGDGALEAALTLMVQHTSASLVIQENADPEVQTDLQAYFHRLVPPTTDPSMAYLTHTYEGPDDMPAHIKSSVLGAGLTLPITDGRLNVGTWQEIYLCEHRDYGGARRIVATLQGD